MLCDEYINVSSYWTDEASTPTTSLCVLIWFFKHGNSAIRS